MGIEDVPEEIRVGDYFNHIDMGFLNRRLAITALGPLRDKFLDQQSPGSDHMTVLRNDHLLVTMLIDLCSQQKAPTLSAAVDFGKFPRLFMSIERLYPCRSIYNADFVQHKVRSEIRGSKKILLAYHTSHIVSDTGRMTLHQGYKRDHREAMIGIVQDQGSAFVINPIVIGAPWLDHPRNGSGETLQQLMWHGHDYGEILPEDIREFGKIRDVTVSSADEWISVMRNTPESHVKKAIAKILSDPIKNDWGGEENDHFSSNVTVGGRRRTAAFLLKGPAKFKEMTPAMCGKNGDQINRLTKAPAEIFVVQHSHLIGSAVREILRSLVVTSGRSAKYCVMDGDRTYRLLKAYGQLPHGGET